MKTLIHLLLLSFIASAIVFAQNVDDLQIPEEEDNQFPPESPDNIDTVHEGSGAGIIDEKVENETVPPLEDIKSRVLDNTEVTTITPTSDSNSNDCPTPCVCNTEAGEFVVDCSGYELTTLPSNIDIRTTVLKVNNNKLTEIPIGVSSLKNLKVLNADNNQIMALVPGSVSELPELVTLKVANNRLLEYPQDLKNAFALPKLQEIDLGGNDMRSTMSAELFTNFKSLKKLTLPVTNSDLLQMLCGTLKDSLETVCTGNCNKNSFECPDAPETIDEELIAATTPSTLPIEEDDDVNDPIVNIDIGNNETTEYDNIITTESPITTNVVDETQRSGIAPLSAIVAANEEPTNTTSNEEGSVKVGATTSDTKTGGIDKSVIGLIAAGMIVIIAVITLKKNWGSIKKRFDSTPRAPERAANGATATAEEVPLQDKSPV